MAEDHSKVVPKERGSEPFSVVVWNKLREEPAQAAALAYFWLVAVGFAHLFGSGMAFGINIVDLASPSDFLVAGLRDPVVTIIGAVSALILYSLWGRWRRSRRSLIGLAASAIALLVVGACLSALYRYEVVLGSARTLLGAPLPLTIRLSKESGGKSEVECARIGVTTSDFVVVGISSCQTTPARRLVIARSEIKQLEMSERCSKCPESPPTP